MIDYLRGFRVGVLRRGGNALERSLAAIDDETGVVRGAGRTTAGPFWPVDAWVHALYGVGLLAAAAVALTIHWIDPPTAVRGLLAIAASALFLLVGLALVRAPTRRGKALRRYLTDPRDRTEFEAAAANADRIRLTWPALERMAEPADPTPTLERALWDLAQALAERGELRAADRDLRASVGEPIGAGSLFTVVTDRQAAIARRLTEVDAEIRRRATQLRRLAELCQEFLDHRAAQSRARLRVTAADALLGSLRARPEPDLVARTEVVLAAYRELADEYT
ncbi:MULTISPECIES: hypothetical protein [Dactylosporangium]|uniref:Uncharacterized protein n=2 Tax=Dactylosporangium TaxID=35753 RepID=A0A9W6KL66_9ACTN|nr:MULTISPECIES: hypothetical protein [Dactylosporangium]UAB97430.1 hypothetical protein Dvina_04425 [Dactylosporangium vinaceum]UWZ45697.1 hypothetical protein Dmats_04035 [Dactylosporangium matsuzakiense]GLL04051.1 hypothetical protein GCM10017581_057980 [Dactylosporangium matsuzakiense]